MTISNTAIPSSPASPTAPTDRPITIHPPGSSSAPELADGPGGFDRDKFMGVWSVVWSTLPMWKSRKDVTFTYVPHLSPHGPVSVFDSDVAYRSRKADIASAPSHIRGVETLTANTNGATFDWHGKGLLRYVSSHWEVLGLGEVEGIEWCVITFSKTLFTPAGMDLLVRDPSAAGCVNEKIRELAKQKVLPAIMAAKGEVGKMAVNGFAVP